MLELYLSVNNISYGSPSPSSQPNFWNGSGGNVVLAWLRTGSIPNISEETYEKRYPHGEPSRTSSSFSPARDVTVQFIYSANTSGSKNIAEIDFREGSNPCKYKMSICTERM